MSPDEKMLLQRFDPGNVTSSAVDRLIYNRICKNVDAAESMIAKRERGSVASGAMEFRLRDGAVVQVPSGLLQFLPANFQDLL
jgi:hypothetical protein